MEDDSFASGPVLLGDVHAGLGLCKGACKERIEGICGLAIRWVCIVVYKREEDDRCDEERAGDKYVF